MTLKSILCGMYLKALQSGEPQTTNLQHGLGLSIAIKDGQATLQLSRNWTNYPSDVEYKTVLDAWPYPVAIRPAVKRENKRRRILETTLPVQEVLL